MPDAKYAIAVTSFYERKESIMNPNEQRTASIVADVRNIRCDQCKVAIHDELATQCAVCGARFDSIISNHAGLAKKLYAKREAAGVTSCKAR